MVEDYLFEFIRESGNFGNYVQLAKPTALDRPKTSNYQQECLDSIGAIANVFVQLFSHPEYPPSNKLLSIMVTKKEAVEQIFSLSSWKTTDPIIEKLNLLEVLKLKKHQVSKRKLRGVYALLALICLDSKYPLPWKHLFDLDPRMSYFAYLGLLGESNAALSQLRNDNYNRLLEIAEDLPIISLNEEDAHGFANSYMVCSYATSDKKYTLKKWISAVLQKNIKNWVSKEVYTQSIKVLGKNVPPRPKVGIVLEAYGTTHAMYRSFNAGLTSLAQECDLIAIINHEEVKRSDLSIFTEVVGIDVSHKLSNHAQQILDAQLDVLFYPSVGMRLWSTVLAFMRLAPIQFMMGGHPSSSYSNEMDYFVIPGNKFSAEDIQPFIHEKVIMSKDSNTDENFATKNSNLSDSFIEQNQQYLAAADTIVVGINGIIQKVTMDLLKACKVIQNRSKVKVKFVFFSHYPDNHIVYISTRLRLQESLSEFELVGFDDYEGYLGNINKCHLLLPTLPFGGSNSNVDAMILLKPKLFININKELYTRTDTVDWMRVGLAKELGSDTIDEMIDKALALIENEDQRYAMYLTMKEKICMDKLFFDNNAPKRKLLNRHLGLIISDFKNK